jgi:hypothetical protein
VSRELYEVGVESCGTNFKNEMLVSVKYRSSQDKGTETLPQDLRSLSRGFMRYARHFFC